MTPEFVELHRWAGLAHVWSESDCIMVLGDWIRQRCGADPFEAERGTYSGPGEAQRLYRCFDDPVAAMSERLARIGILPTDEPVSGDVALILVPGDRRPVGAIWTGASWGMKGPDRGAVTMRPDVVRVLQVWRLPDAA